jgi:hypothetical protein
MWNRVHLALCLLAAPLFLWAAVLLDQWILASAEPTDLLSYRSYAWVSAISRFLVALLAFGLSWLALHRQPNGLVATVYLGCGALLTFAVPLAVVGVILSPALLSPLLHGASSHLFSFACASLAALGVAAFIRRYLFIMGARSSSK